jgi:hypothetical protein
MPASASKWAVRWPDWARRYTASGCGRSSVPGVSRVLPACALPNVRVWCCESRRGARPSTWVGGVYLIILNLPLVPGRTESIPFRPWLIAAVSGHVNVAIFSRLGVRDIFFRA